MSRDEVTDADRIVEVLRETRDVVERIAAALEKLVEIQAKQAAEESADRKAAQAHRDKIQAAVEKGQEMTRKSLEQGAEQIKKQAEAVDVMRSAVPPPEPWERGVEGDEEQG